ncbi:MAG: S9 family peptidase [Bacteroidales bacterium]|nr:S9 family peptidase [Bacteroidales bacterium]
MSCRHDENKKWVYQGVTWLEPDYELCLVNLSDGGTDKGEIREYDAVKKEFVKNGFFVEASKSSASWFDRNTLLISPDQGSGTVTTSGYPRIVKKWKRNTPLKDATVIFETDSANLGTFPLTFYSGNRLITGFVNGVSFYNQEIYFLQGDKYVRSQIPVDAEVKDVFDLNMTFALQSDWKVNGTMYLAGALLSLNIDDDIKGKLNVKLIHQPDASSSIESVSACKDFMIVNLVENVKSKLLKYRLVNDKWVGSDINAPGFGSIYVVSSENTSNDYFFLYTSTISPSTLYYGQTDKLTKTKQERNYFDASNLKVEQYWATSKDGTKIPYFITFNKNMVLNGKNPVIIDAYGGFNISSKPDYDKLGGMAWLEQGGVSVIANIRGGGEFGPSWHLSAIKDKRQNAYDDYFAVAEDLIKRNITSPAHLGIFGWSNGGLLTGVAFTQRPDLYKAAIIGAPLLDMKRYSKLLAGASWMAEYGDPDKPEDWEYLKKFSPYQNMMKDKKYPEVFFVTSITDDRVHPGHARKMAAKMAGYGHPFYYHETLEGGHGAASTNKQAAEMYAMIFTYLRMKLMP